MAARRKPAVKRRESGPVPLGIWLVLGLLVALLAAVLVVLLTRTPAPPSSEPAASAPRDVREVRKEAEPEPVPPPRFEFYRLLPDQPSDLPVPPPAAQPAPPPVAVPESPTPSPADSTERFLLQVGSFRAREDAERRRAEVALLGYASSIASAEVNGATVYRVQIGPLAAGEAREAESRLKQASIEPLRRRVGP